MKILVIFTGGTISCSNYDGVLTANESNFRLLLDLYGEAGKDIEFVCKNPYTALSENLCAENLNKLYDCLQGASLNGCDGVIVTHGTDTLQYTAAFLSYAFSGSSVPIVLASANYPLADSRSNGVENFAAAVDFIRAKQGKGVFAAYKNENSLPEIHRASRLLPHMPYSDALYSVFNSFYGEIKDGKFIANPKYSEQTDKAVLKNKIPESPDVLKISPYVDMAFPKIGKNTKAILLEGYHSGTLNTAGESLRRFCGEAEERGIPVFLTGACRGFYYESKLLYNDLKIRVLPPASPIAMYVKLRLLGRENINDVFLPCGADFCGNAAPFSPYTNLR